MRLPFSGAPPYSAMAFASLLSPTYFFRHPGDSSFARSPRTIYLARPHKIIGKRFVLSRTRTINFAVFKLGLKLVARSIRYNGRMPFLHLRYANEI